MSESSTEKPRVFKNLEMHVTHACNLACESCSHYSNQNHKGYISTTQAEEWIRAWHRRIEPEFFSLMGGEPTLHSDLGAFVEIARAYWPKARLRVVTNGLLLHRHPDLPRVLEKAGNTLLQISIHHEALSFLGRLNDNAAMLREWIREYDIDVSFSRSFSNWARRYIGYGADMRPYDDGDPQASWSMCHSRWCKQLFEGLIWKCAPLAYLRMQNEKYGLSEHWSPYLDYEPLHPECSNQELEAFFSRRTEPQCAMCPAHERPFRKPIPFPNRSEPDLEYIEKLDPFLLFAVGYNNSNHHNSVRNAAEGDLDVEMLRRDDENYEITIKLNSPRA